jgi:hypothetical protein
MQDIYGITEEALREGKPHPYYHKLFIRIEEEMHPVTKLDIVQRWRMRERRRVSLCR